MIEKEYNEMTVRRLQLIMKGDPSVLTVTGKKTIQPGVRYRWSDFVFPFTFQGKAFLFHNLTKACWCLDGDALDTDKAVRFSEEEMRSDDDKRILCEQLFLVPEDKDETTFYESYLKLARLLNRANKGYHKYTILPTTACNARCVYCFEQGFRYETMKPETVEQLIRFILKTRRKDKEIVLVWFGGEPLVGEKIIDRVCGALREAGVPFRSNMVSNGSLITESVIEKMRGAWNLKRIQVTLDGVEEEYNRRKNYYHDYPSAYWHVLGRLKLLNQIDVRLNVRVNVDEGNIDGVMQMFADLDPFLPNKERVTVTLSPLFDVQALADSYRVWDKCIALYDKVEALGYRLTTHAQISKTAASYCMADSPKSAVVVTPDGKIHNCEHIGAFPPLGDIWDGVTDKELYNSLLKVEKAREKCRGCLFLPSCTTFSRCPDVKGNCKYPKAAQLRHALCQRLSAVLPADEESESFC